MELYHFNVSRTLRINVSLTSSFSAIELVGLGSILKLPRLRDGNKGDKQLRIERKPTIRNILQPGDGATDLLQLNELMIKNHVGSISRV